MGRRGGLWMFALVAAWSATPGAGGPSQLTQDTGGDATTLVSQDAGGVDSGSDAAVIVDSGSVDTGTADA